MQSFSEIKNLFGHKNGILIIIILRTATARGVLKNVYQYCKMKRLDKWDDSVSSKRNCPLGVTFVGI